VVLADHARSLDWNSRHAELICSLPDEVVHDVAAKIIALIAED
jgi:mRNA-degrading endonuclease toxin of MazEF toxin-antitoxin module